MPAESDILPAPDLTQHQHPSKFDREVAAYHRLVPELLSGHRGQYVAVHNSQAVDFGSDPVALAMKQYERFGRVPIYIGLVTDAPPMVSRVRSPRHLQDRAVHGSSHCCSVR